MSIAVPRNRRFSVMDLPNERRTKPLNDQISISNNTTSRASSAKCKPGAIITVTSMAPISTHNNTSQTSNQGAKAVTKGADKNNGMGEVTEEDYGAQTATIVDDVDINKRNLCTSCSKVNLSAFFEIATHCRDDGMRVVPSNNALRLGMLKDIISRSRTCSLCKTVVNAVSSTFPYDRLGLQPLLARLRSTEGGTDCWLYSYRFFQDTGDSNGNLEKTYRVAISTLHPSKDIVYSSAGVARRHHAGDIQLMLDSAKRLGLSGHFHGRRLQEGCVDKGLLKQWLHICENQHGMLCKQPDLERRDLFSIPPPKEVTVIDVSRNCLTVLPPGARYITLSYCCPPKTNFVTIKDNKAALMVEGAIGFHTASLSNTIQDAIDCTRELGEKYLWVDSLCIVQDDGRDKHHQISQMDLIYSNAELTIVAAHYVENDSSSGLPGYRPGSRSVCPQNISIAQGLELAIALPCLEDLLSRTRWDTRGWTFQETMLSRRLLYFTEAQAYFQCSCGICCEDTAGEIHDPTAFVALSTNLWNPKNVYSMASEDNYGQLSLVHTLYSDDETALRAYNNFVSRYLRRELSYAEDILNALNGLLRIFERSMKTKFLCGLPEKWFDHALLWKLVGPAKKRMRVKCGLTIANGDEDADTNCEFLTWSWAGWDTLSETPYWLLLDHIRPLLHW
jgi:hypothetical protein